MKIFLDTANIEEIRAAADSGLVDGITTNPSLVSKESRSFAEILKDVCDLIQGPVSAEVVATDFEGMLKEGLALAEISPHIVVKVPLTPSGLKACKALREKDVAVNVTLCFSAVQALLAAKAGATYISPFLGRLDDIGQEGMRLIEEIYQIYAVQAFETEILAASIRHPEHVLRAAKAGADVVTLPPKVFHQLFQHPLTDAGLAKFLEDAKKIKA